MSRVMASCSWVGVSLGAALSITVLFSPRVHGWGSGHHTQAQMVLDSLPREIKAFFSRELQTQIVQKYCCYPDTVRSFEGTLLGKDTVDELKRLKVSPGDLHQDLNVALSFVFLHRAFAANNPRQAAVWLGSLIHTIGDDGCHLTLLAYLSELRRFKNRPPMGESCSDLSQLTTNSEGRALLNKLMDGYTPRGQPPVGWRLRPGTAEQALGSTQASKPETVAGVQQVRGRQ